MFILTSIMAITHGNQIPPAEFPFIDVKNFSDIVGYLRQQFNTDNLTTKNQVTVTTSSFFGDTSASNRMYRDTVLFDPMKNEGRYLTADEPWTQRPWMDLNFHEVKITLKHYTILYNSQPQRWMRSYTIAGLDASGEWINLHHVNNSDPINTTVKLPRSNSQNYLAYSFDIPHPATYSQFRIFNDGPDSWNSDYFKNANILSLAKILMYGRVEGGKILISPIKLERQAQYILNLGMLGASEI